MGTIGWEDLERDPDRRPAGALHRDHRPALDAGGRAPGRSGRRHGGAGHGPDPRCPRAVAAQPLGRVRRPGRGRAGRDRRDRAPTGSVHVAAHGDGPQRRAPPPASPPWPCSAPRDRGSSSPSSSTRTSTRPTTCVRFRDPLPEGVDFEFDRPPMPFWEEIVEARPAIGRPAVGAVRTGPGRGRLLVPARLAADARRRDPRPGRRHRVVRHHAGCGRASGSVLTRARGSAPAPTSPSTCSGSARPGWLLAHGKARHAGDGYASVDMALWDPTERTPRGLRHPGHVLRLRPRGPAWPGGPRRVVPDRVPWGP